MIKTAGLLASYCLLPLLHVAAAPASAPNTQQPVLTYSRNPVEMGQTINFTCTTFNGGAFVNSPSTILSAILYIITASSQTQVALAASSTSSIQTFPCHTLSTFSGRAVQCVVSSTYIVFSLSSVLLSDQNVYGCQVFADSGTNSIISSSPQLSVYALPQQPAMSLDPPNPLVTHQTLSSVTCMGNVGYPGGQFSLLYLPTGLPDYAVEFSWNPSVTSIRNADGTYLAVYTYNFTANTCITTYSICFGGLLSKSNNGDMYKCVAFNDYSSKGIKTASVTLNVQYYVVYPAISLFVNSQPVGVFSARISVNVNDCVYLTCSSTGNPTPVVSWIQVSSQANQSLAIINSAALNYNTSATVTGYLANPDYLTFVCLVGNSIINGVPPINPVATVYTQTIYLTVNKVSNSANSSTIASRSSDATFMNCGSGPVTQPPTSTKASSLSTPTDVPFGYYSGAVVAVAVLLSFFGGVVIFGVALFLVWKKLFKGKLPSFIKIVPSSPPGNGIQLELVGIPPPQPSSELPKSPEEQQQQQQQQPQQILPMESPEETPESVHRQLPITAAAPISQQQENKPKLPPLPPKPSPVGADEEYVEIPSQQKAKTEPQK